MGKEVVIIRYREKAQNFPDLKATEPVVLPFALQNTIYMNEKKDFSRTMILDHIDLRELKTRKNSSHFPEAYFPLQLRV